VSRQCRGCCHVDIRETVAPAQKPATPAFLGYGPYGYDLGGSACHVTPLPGTLGPCNAGTKAGDLGVSLGYEPGEGRLGHSHKALQLSTIDEKSYSGKYVRVQYLPILYDNDTIVVQYFFISLGIPNFTP